MEFPAAVRERLARADRLPTSLLVVFVACALAASGYAGNGRGQGGAGSKPPKNPPTTSCSTGQLKATYFANVSLSGTPVLTRCESAIAYSWEGGSPDASVPADNFSARWEGSVDVGAGDILFTVTADDGVRLWVDGALLVDRWFDQPATTYRATKTLAAGTHQLKVEYYEHLYGAFATVRWANGSADTTPPSAPGSLHTTNVASSSVELAWTAATDDVGVAGYEVLNGTAVVSTATAATATVAGLSCGTGYTLGVRAFDAAGNRGPASTVSATTTACAPPPTSCTAGEFTSEYFANTTLSGTPALSRCETKVDYSWSGGSPDPSVPSDNFSARWSGTFSFAGGDTTFTVTADDGVRLRVDGTLLIDRWVDEPATTYTATKTLTAGSHTVRVEYYEAAYAAVARVGWTTSTSPPPPPTGGGRIGTSSHTRGETDMRTLLQTAGATWMRDDALWESIESTKGTFNWNRLDTLFGNASRAGLAGFLVIADYAPSWAGIPPANDADYATFCARLVNRYGPGGAFWAANPTLRPVELAVELWNENYMSYAWGGKLPDPQKYARMARAAASAIRNTGKTVAVGGSVDLRNYGDGSLYFENLLSYDPTLFKLLDFWAVHPYTGNSAPDAQSQASNDLGTDWEFERIPKIQSVAAAHGATLPIWVTEFGYSTWSGGVTEAQQASYTAAAITRAIKDWGVERFFTYTGDRDGTNTADREAKFGLFRNDGSAKPVAAAMKNLATTNGW
jgi:RNase P/RNase MRP subunit p29